MPNQALSHDHCRHRTCIACVGKARRAITPGLHDLIQKHVFPDYHEHQNKLPCKICDNCRKNLSSHSNPDSTKWKPMTNKCDHVQLLDQLNTLVHDVTSIDCTCDICKSAKRKGNNVKRSRGPKTQRDTKTKPVTLSLCSKCMGTRKRGVVHKCNKVNKYKNVQQLLSPQTKELVSTSFIKKSTSQRYKPESLSLRTRTRSMNVTVPGIRKMEEPKVKINHKMLLDMQLQENLSNKQTNRIASSFRQGGGDVEPNFRPALVSRGRVLSDFFEERSIKWCHKEKDSDVVITLTKQSIMCKDVKGLVDYVCQKRQLIEPLLRLGIDGGQGFVKVCINIIDTTSSESNVPRSKRGFLDSGVKRLFILGIVQDKCEMYENLREMLSHLDLLNCTGFDYILATDLKVCNIMAGIQNHSATYPCTWCYTKLPHKKKAKPRTLGEIKKYHAAYVKAKCRNAPKYYNCVNEPLIKGKDTDKMIDVLPPPPLHLMLGVVNTVFDKLQDKWDQAYTWAARHNIVKKNYHGGCMEGPACHALLKKVHVLELALPRRLTKFATTLSCFDKVVTACFKHELEPDYLVKIERFRTSYLKLGINITPKVHAVFDHVGEFCKKKNMGLAKFAEQASESVHRDFLQEWNRCKCDVSHPDYAKTLCECVVRYNSKHLG